ncbi:lytic polysaccharide monooxygenase [Pseudosporangium ferrugineum]|uniref:Chitin-binding protein n=1 Tax=Pseudosporangium ferrugineum TaxID=439699 RepID=A0A2T0SJ78_9ACTN|nr:lytic polysaccharide monooxygenase [Pseudosporangium ferrugineum]PRY33470.1 chitin-binding protein [Pseudosporangium ferrugineum]
MRSVRRIAALAVSGGIAAAVAVLPAVPALAHGAPTSPISRTAACAAGGEEADAAACRAARAANGRPFGSFDNLRVPDVAGKDRQFIPDGNLCSGDLPEFQGLDLPRTDWPSTRVAAGTTLSVTYAGTIPHEGTFRLYLTGAGYDPRKPLGWGDLTPLAEIKDPPLRGGAYRMSVKLPKDRSGRHVLYTVWQTSSTPDTYYSCSDLVFKQARTRTAVAGPAKKPTPKASRSAEPGAVAVPPDAQSPAAAAAAPPAGRESWLSPAAAESQDRVALGHQIVIAALIVITGVSAGAGFLRLRASRSQAHHFGPPRRQ